MRALKINMETHKTDTSRIKVSRERTGHNNSGAHRIGGKIFERKLTTQNGDLKEK